ncbi:hypothetical protein JTE90_000414 [Oedothorax gibbosus]|uniref:Uncharacterized protein n=1 Tax=Oedothorax gibbosus TaxID=931172 RepID=A0AAV6TFY6_9ARAC|nr:hypothetical protein JTE90_000414 [Oedothorax gibbosus]
MIGRADIEGSKRTSLYERLAVPRASIPVVKSSDTSCIKLVKSKRIDRPCFRSPIHTGKIKIKRLLPFLLYASVLVTRGCSPWRPCLRIWVRTRHRTYTISLGIKGQQRRHRTRKRRGAFTRTASPISTSRFQGHELLQRKDKLFPVLRRRLRVSVAYRMVPKDISPCRVGNINPIPVRSRQRENTRFVLRFGRRLASERISPIP